MKVALDVSAVPAKVAGAGRYVVELARRLPEIEVDATLVTQRGDDARWRDVAPTAAIAPLVPNARAARLVYEALRLGTSSVARRADLWHAPHYTMPRRRRVPTVVTIHDLTFFTNPEWHERAKVPFFRRAITYAASHADALIVVSDFSARQLSELVRPSVPVVVAPLGVDLDRFRPEDDGDLSRLAQSALPTDVPYVFFVGTAEPRKGLDVLLDAFTSLALNDPVVELWLAGQSGWSTGPLEDRLATHRYKHRIRRLGFVSDELLTTLYRRAQVVTYPSRGEGFGLPVLEAMACGALCVTTRDTVMAEVAGNGADVVPVGDAHALASALEAALKRPDEERRAQRERARRRAETFTWTSCLAHHREAYEIARG